MVTDTLNKSATYLRIVVMLGAVRDQGLISSEEYSRAKQYYKKLTGADLIITS